MRRAALAAVAALLLAALVEGCAVEPAALAAGTPDHPPVAAVLPPPPLLPLERLPATARANPASTVVPVVSDGSVDPDEDAVEPGVDFERGGASWYGSRFQGRRTASGERFDMEEMTAAHRTLPFGSLICVRNVGNGRAVLVRASRRWRSRAPSRGGCAVNKCIQKVRTSACTPFWRSAACLE
jgi:rare lipoprotein A